MALSEEDLKWAASLKEAQKFNSQEKSGVLRGGDGQSGKSKSSWAEKLEDDKQKAKTDVKSR